MQRWGEGNRINGRLQVENIGPTQEAYGQGQGPSGSDFFPFLEMPASNRHSAGGSEGRPRTLPSKRAHSGEEACAEASAAQGEGDPRSQCPGNTPASCQQALHPPSPATPRLPEGPPPGPPLGPQGSSPLFSLFLTLNIPVMTPLTLPLQGLQNPPASPPALCLNPGSVFPRPDDSSGLPTRWLFPQSCRFP